MIVFYTVLLFCSGSLMFSYWIGLLLKKDLTMLNDGNPGASNLWASAGAGWGLAGIFPDFMKGYLPLAMLIWSRTVSGYALIPLAIAPILGHAISPFLKFKGGRCKAVTFGVWSALTNFEVSIAFAVILAMIELFANLLHIERKDKYSFDACTAVGGMLLLGGYLVIREFPIPIILIWLFNFAIFIAVNFKMMMRRLKVS